MHALLEKSHALGARAVLAVFDEATREALASFQRWRKVALWAVVPNMFSFIRDLTDLGMVGAAAARFRRLSPRDMLKTGLGAALRAEHVLRRDFATGVMLVAEMELLALRRLEVTRICLHPQVTELALAGGVVSLFDALARKAEAMGLECGIVTHNPLAARSLLKGGVSRFASVVAPCSASGYKMFPSREACLTLMREEPARYVAAEITGGGRASVGDAVAEVRRIGLGGALLAPAEVESAFRDGLAL